MLKRFIINFLSAFRIPLSAIPSLYSRVLKIDRHAYRPFFNPMYIDQDFQSLWIEISKGTTSQPETCYYLKVLASSVASIAGEFWECGVYKGGTALLLGNVAKEQGKRLELFDSFEGMLEQTKEVDSFKLGSLGDTSEELVKSRLSELQNVGINKGFIPETFSNFKNVKISFAHVDVDQYETTLRCCEFIYPRLQPGGIIVIDDYGRPGTPGARYAAERFFNSVKETIVPLPTGQGMIIKSR